MVVLAASVVTKTGKALVSRQYIDMSRIRIEGLLAAFPKLIGTGKQHTFVETDNVRYLYQPMEGLYLLIITNKQSNILEDLDTLRLLSKVVPETVAGLEEEAVCQAAFDLVFSFDEVISLGNKENITVMQVKQNCEMESHEEKLHNMIIQSKINETKDVMKRKAQEIEKSKIVTGKDKMGMAAMAGFGSISAENEPAPSYMKPEPVLPSMAASKPTSKGPSKGMQLGKARKGNDLLESLAKEGEVMQLDVPKAPGAMPTIVNTSSDPVSIALEEKLTVLLNKQGGVENLLVEGTMSLLVSTDEGAFTKIQVESGPNKGFQFKTHPNIDKAAYSSDNVLALKDPSRPFPTGSELGVLKWRMQSRDESLVPITINCWPSVSGGESYVNIEYESSDLFDLQHVQIVIPLPHAGHAPAVNQIDDGDWRYDSRNSALVWSLDLIDDSNRSGAMEFVVSAADAETFYPISVSFTTNKTFCDIGVESVVSSTQGNTIKYSCKKQMQTVEYLVE